MGKGILIVLAAAALGALVGCEQGACYYTCCSEEGVCNLECQTQVESAEDCAVLADDTCRENEDRNIGRLEWKTVSDLYCDDCSSVACAPEWWTQKKISTEAGDDYVQPCTDHDTDPDGGE